MFSLVWDGNIYNKDSKGDEAKPSFMARWKYYLATCKLSCCIVIYTFVFIMKCSSLVWFSYVCNSYSGYCVYNEIWIFKLVQLYANREWIWISGAILWREGQAICKMFSKHGIIIKYQYSLGGVQTNWFSRPNYESILIALWNHRSLASNTTFHIYRNLL